MPSKVSRVISLSECHSVISGMMPETTVKILMKRPMTMATWWGLIRFGPLDGGAGVGDAGGLVAVSTVLRGSARRHADARRRPGVGVVARPPATEGGSAGHPVEGRLAHG